MLLTMISIYQIYVYLPATDVSNALLKPLIFEGVDTTGLLFPGKGGGG